MDIAFIQMITSWAIIIFIALIFIYDGWAFFKGGTKGTVSYVIVTKWSREYPAFTFGIGFIMGHLFWALDTCGG